MSVLQRLRKNSFNQIKAIHLLFFFAVVLWFPVSAQNCQFTIARLKYDGGGDWYANPSSLPNLVSSLKKRTSIPVCDTIAVIEINDAQLFNFPLLYMTGHGDVKFTHQEKLRLRKFLI
jgi:hypothetical protein